MISETPKCEKCGTDNCLDVNTYNLSHCCYCRIKFVSVEDDGSLPCQDCDDKIKAKKGKKTKKKKGKKPKPEPHPSESFMELLVQMKHAQDDGVRAEDFLTDNKIVLGKLSAKKLHKHMDMFVFAELIKYIAEDMDFKISSRGWAYQLENYRIINKDEFGRIQNMINKCRKNGLLPIDFVAEESSRKFEEIWKIRDNTPEEEILNSLKSIKEVPYYVYTGKENKSSNVDYWNGEEYYIQVLVEKVDLLTLFKPICEKYKIPIANSKGWSSISQRADMIKRFKEHEEDGRTPVLLYCGDHDPAGIQISDLLAKNLNDLSLGTGWTSDNLIVDRFGLNYDFIEENNLTWIDNLITGSGKEADETKLSVAEYVEEYGRRKCEANAIIVRPQQARDLCEEAIHKYLGTDADKRFRKKRKDVVDAYNKIRESPEFNEAYSKLLEILNK